MFLPGTGASADYMPVSVNLTFTADDSMMCVNLTILDDTIVEGNQSFSVSLQSEANQPVIFTPHQEAIVVILDDDGKSSKVFTTFGVSVFHVQ